MKRGLVRGFYEMMIFRPFLSRIDCLMKGLQGWFEIMQRFAVVLETGKELHN